MSMALTASLEPVWLVEQRRQGEALVVRETGQSVTKFSRKQLVSVLRDCSYARPPRIHTQAKSTLVADVQRWVMSEREGSSILTALKQAVHG